MEKVNVLSVNSYDLLGKRFNSYDLIDKFDNVDIRQIVVEKHSQNNKVTPFFKNYKEFYIFRKFQQFEKNNSIQDTFSITSQILVNSDVYKNSDIVHIQLLHNSFLSLFSLIEISNNKKLLISFHDPWYLTGHCVHYLECEKWIKDKCINCPSLDRYFPIHEDKSNQLWQLKHNVFEKITCSIFANSKWIINSIKKSDLVLKNNNKHLIPLALDTNLFMKKANVREKYGIADEFVIFFRSEKEFKGIEQIIEALSKLKSKKKIVLLTCGRVGLVKELETKYKVIELGTISTEELIDAYSAADLFLMPSIGETFGMMAIEAMSCSCPIIVFEKTSLPDITFAPTCGYAVEYKNAKKLKEAIQFLMDNPKEREKRANLGRDIAVKEYNLKKHFDRMQKMYLKIFNNNEIKSRTEEFPKSNNDNILTKLNELTDIIFKSKRIKCIFKFDCQNDYSAIDYSDLSVQARINDYCKSVYDLIQERHIFVPLKYIILFYIKKNKKTYDFIKKIFKGEFNE